MSAWISEDSNIVIFLDAECKKEIKTVKSA